MAQYLLAYDISEPARLRRVAKCLEFHAIRVQKSVFLFDGNREELHGLQRQLVQLIDVHEDRLQSWPIRQTRDICRWNAGKAWPGTGSCLVVTTDDLILLTGDSP